MVLLDMVGVGARMTPESFQNDGSPAIEQVPAVAVLENEPNPARTGFRN